MTPIFRCMWPIAGRTRRYEILDPPRRAGYRCAFPDRHVAGRAAGRRDAADGRRCFAGWLRAWRLGRNVYLRTRYTLLSPEWTASEAEGGTTVYAVPSTPVVLLSVNGRTVSALLKDPS